MIIDLYILFAKTSNLSNQLITRNNHELLAEENNIIYLCLVIFQLYSGRENIIGIFLI